MRANFVLMSRYAVRTARNGPEALEMCRRTTAPDGVLMDLGMPKMIAVELIRGLHEVVPGALVLAMTGYVDPAMHARIVASGVHRIVQKPFAMDELLRNVREMFDADAATEAAC